MLLSCNFFGSEGWKDSIPIHPLIRFFEKSEERRVAVAGSCEIVVFVKRAEICEYCNELKDRVEVVD